MKRPSTECLRTGQAARRRRFATARLARGGGRQTGFTLVEILVALTVGLIVAAAAVAALLIGRQGFTNTDSAAQLRENARFAAGLLQRITLQSGFENLVDEGFPAHGQMGYLRGYDNASVGATGDVGLTHNSRSAACGDTSCANGSDVLVVRYKGASRNGIADNSMIDCAGQPVPAATAARPYAISIFNVKRSQAGEPTLMCTYQNAAGDWIDVPLVQGVESFQVLYGTDGVTQGVDSGNPDLLTSNADTIPDRYLRATQMDASSGTPYSPNNWARVRSLRIGLLMRGPAGSAVDRVATAMNYELLGAGFSASDQLSVPADGRLRQKLVFTVHLRNPQSAP